MPLALPVVAVGLLALLLALVLAVVATALVEGMAKQVPVVGGYIARGAGAAVDYAVSHVRSWSRTFTNAVTEWLVGLATGGRDLADAAARFAVSVVAQLDHLTHVTVHEIVKAFVNPVRDIAHDAQATAEQAQAGVDVLAREFGDRLEAIPRQIEREVTHLHNVISEVELPALGSALGHVIGQVEADAVGRIGDLRHYTDAEFDRVYRRLGDIPLARLLELLAAFGATAALVDVIANEAGLGRAECRSKVRGICSTDPAAWQQLLAATVPLFAWTSLRELLDLGVELVDAARPLLGELAAH